MERHPLARISAVVAPIAFVMGLVGLVFADYLRDAGAFLLLGGWITAIVCYAIWRVFRTPRPKVEARGFDVIVQPPDSLDQRC